jgi:hypothetical protein
MLPGRATWARSGGFVPSKNLHAHLTPSARPTMIRTLLAPVMATVLAGVLALVGHAQVGTPLPDPGLVDFAKTEATTFGDYTGRLVLFEFFAHW